MTGELGRGYRICREEERLIFTTSSFRVDPESVLHSGIYNREFSSMLASATVAGAVYVIAAMNGGSAAVSSLVFLLVFAAGVLLFRKFVFRESLMEVVFDGAGGEVQISTSRMTKRLLATVAMEDIEKIMIERRIKEVENPDAVKFVEKISAQHGTVIPGFGKESVKFILKLRIADGTERVIYSDDSMEDVISAHDEIKDFLGKLLTGKWTFDGNISPCLSLTKRRMGGIFL